MPKKVIQDESESENESDESLDLDESSDGDSDSSIGGSINSEPANNKQTGKKENKTSATDSSVPNNKRSRPESPSVLKIPSKKSTSVTPATLPTHTTHSLKPSSSSSVPQNSTTHDSSSFASADITRGPPVTTEVAAKKLIAQYLTQQNRPYSAIQVHDNLHKRIPKATVERVLTSLSQPSPSLGFVCKEYGKAKIYFVDQNSLVSDFTPAQLETLTQENDAIKAENERLGSEERRLKGELTALCSEAKDSELDICLAEVVDRVAEKRARVQRLSNQGSNSNGGGDGASSSKNSAGRGFTSLSDATAAHNQYRKAWHSRKVLCMEMVDLLSDGMNKKVKDVMAEMCLESDQDAGVTLPPPLPEIV